MEVICQCLVSSKLSLRKVFFMALNGSENLQKKTAKHAILLPHSKIGGVGVGIPGNFRVLKVRIAEIGE